MLEDHGVQLSLARLNSQAACSLQRDELFGHFERGGVPPGDRGDPRAPAAPAPRLSGRSVLIDAIERNDEDLVAALI